MNSSWDWIIESAGVDLWLAVVCISVAGGLTAMLVRHALHLRNRRRRRLQLGPPCRGVEAAGWEGVVTLEGRLAHRLPCQRFEDGAEAAAATTEARLSRTLRGWYPVQHVSAQAEDLMLRLEDGAEIGLHEPVKVVVGSREQLPRKLFSRLDLALQRRTLAADPGAKQLANHRVALRSLRSGDRVVALGRLAQRPLTGGEGSYRASTHRWALTSTDEESVLLAHAGPTDRRLLAFRGLRTSLVTAIICGVTLLGAGMQVYASTTRAATKALRASAIQFGPADQQCRQSFECRVFGECAASRAWILPGRRPDCVARGDAGCRASRNCRLHDECAASRDHCW